MTNYELRINGTKVIETVEESMIAIFIEKTDIIADAWEYLIDGNKTMSGSGMNASHDLNAALGTGEDNSWQ